MKKWRVTSTRQKNKLNGKDSRKKIVIRQTNRKMRGKEIKLGNFCLSEKQFRQQFLEKVELKKDNS